jgi:hypothetical protein
MKVLKYIPFIILSACSSTRNLDKSIHYSNYQTYSISHNDSPKPYVKDSNRNDDEILYSSDAEYLQDTRSSRSNQNRRDNRTYNVQNYYENADSSQNYNRPIANSSQCNSNGMQILPPNLFFRAGEYNPFKH